MSTCCGDYHYADCPLTDRPQEYSDFDDYAEWNGHEDYADPATCEHTDWYQSTFQRHEWRVVDKARKYVECQHCTLIGPAGQFVEHRIECPVWRSERTCEQCDTDLPIIDLEDAS